MKRNQRVLSSLLAMSLVFTSVAPAFATEMDANDYPPRLMIF